MIRPVLLSAVAAAGLAFVGVRSDATQPESARVAGLTALVVAAPQDVVPLTPVAGAVLLSAPDGAKLAQLDSGIVLTPISRDRGWVRVRVDGWVKEDQLVVADMALRMAPSAADVRADPVGMKGRVVRWEMEFIALQRADPLRKDLKADEWYILARGPGAENALSYLVVPDDLRKLAEALPPLTRIVVTARVRVARSDPVGVPILDVETLVKR